MAGITHKALVKEVASNKPDGSTAFNLPDSATAPARSFDSALADGAVVPYHATNGTDWEDGLGTFAAGSPDTLTRNQILESSNAGSAVDFSAGGDVTLRIVWPASIAMEADLLMRSAVPGGRLTLSSGNPDYQPLNTVAVSGQDTGADTITVTAHGWTVGTMVKSSATSGGLTAGTQYYVGNVTTNTVSLHTTLAAALAGTSKVDITGAVTANITANGVANTSIYYSPYHHNLISLWNGYRWQVVEFEETALALGTVTSSKPYDVFAYLSGGVLALEKLEWTNDTTRATEITRQDGRLCKSGDKTRLLLGTFYTISTAATERSKANLYLANLYNTLPFYCEIRDETSSWTYSTQAWRQSNNSSANQINVVLPTAGYTVSVIARNRVTNSTSTYRDTFTGIAVDTVSTALVSFKTPVSSTVGAQDVQCVQDISSMSAGRHYIAEMEFGGGTDTQTWSGVGAQKLMATLNG